MPLTCLPRLLGAQQETFSDELNLHSHWFMIKQNLHQDNGIDRFVNHGQLNIASLTQDKALGFMTSVTCTTFVDHNANSMLIKFQ